MIDTQKQTQLYHQFVPNDLAVLSKIVGVNLGRGPINPRAGSSIPGFQRAVVTIPFLESHGVHVEQNHLCATFGAAHRLPYVPEGHPCGRLHGHTYRIEIPNPSPAIIEIVQQVHRQLAYSDLNTVAGLENPTSEILAAWLWDLFAKKNVSLSQITISETCTARCSYRGK